MGSWQDEFVEQFKAMLIPRANKGLGIFDVSTGLTGTVAEPKVIFAAAIKAAAYAL
jgi:DNA repair protein RadC